MGGIKTFPICCARKVELQCITPFEENLIFAPRMTWEPLRAPAFIALPHNRSHPAF